MGKFIAQDQSFNGLMARAIPVPFSGCMLWEGRISNYGYAEIGNAETRHRVHRLIMGYTLGRALAKDEIVCHKCDVPSCINPAHLYVGTPRDNVRDCVTRGRKHLPKGELHGLAILTAEAVREIRSYPRRRVDRKMLAEKFGVKENTISQVRNGTSWKHVR
jgi:hypothetical protein